MYVRFKLCAHRERFRIPCFVLGALDAGKGEKYERLKKKKQKNGNEKSAERCCCFLSYFLCTRSQTQHRYECIIGTRTFGVPFAS